MSANLFSVLVQEQKRYTLHQLSTLCGVTDEHILSTIKKLKEFGVLKEVKARDEQKDMSELLEQDVAVTDVDTNNSLYYYVFTFVGVIIAGNFVFKVYPKYIQHNDPVAELKLILKVLDKYNSENEIIRLYTETNENKTYYNYLAMLLFFLQDFYENGLYRNSEVVLETNGRGEIRWDKTINETFALISNGRPYYTEFLTRKRIDDDNDYFSRLHKCVITNASRELENADLLDIFELPGVDLSDEVIEDFGDKDYILYRISQALNVQFNSWKQIILKALYVYVENNGNMADYDAFSAYGTTNYNLVWEHVCGAVLNNKLNIPLKYLSLPKPLLEKYKDFRGNTNATLLDIIEKPMWTFTRECASDTFVPDIILIEQVESRHMFIILDAKYYVPYLELGKTPKNQPGIESIAKQYLYQLAYSEFLREQGFSDEEVRNCFIFPTENSDEIDKGDVYMKIFESLELKSIQVRFLPASKVYKYYLDSKVMNLSFR